MKEKFGFLYKILIFFISAVATVLVIWFLLLGKIKLSGLILPWVNHIPKSQAELSEKAKNVLGVAEEAATSENAHKVLQQGAQFFESSSFTEPIRDVREAVKQRLNETLENLKQIPEKEINSIKKDVCQQWQEELNQEETEGINEGE